MAPEARPCFDRGEGFPFCSPLPTDTWVNGSHHEFIWNYNSAYYAAHDYLDLFLYHIEHFTYHSIRNWTQLHTRDGSLPVQVDDSWFPTQLQPGDNNKTWTLYGYYLPSGMDPYHELPDTTSFYPRPFNFSAIQVAPLPNPLQAESSDDHHLQPWMIAVIVIAIVAFLAAVTASVWAFLVSRRNKRKNKLSPTDSSGAPDSHPAAAMTDPEKSRSTVGLVDSVSIYSNTPMMLGRSSGSLRHSGTENASTIRSANTWRRAELSPSSPTLASVTHPMSSHLAHEPSSPPANAFRSMLPSTNQRDDDEEEDRRRRLGQVLLQQQLAEEGTSVKHAEKRPVIAEVQPEARPVILEHASSASSL
ncbi:uncharacterized protein BYT42DRAFT_590179 [Radiomyces spectabilis]|uniref:uncharacterized protein n=1 Tax=Radiomyces spectabilis TaxID=64574 RepID=UPI00221EC407|nr:uncharacterized protein BYT42DRAFT_590179 [Radiomyces spectabilis]KAI8364731.1 hypothetical protein BYT42DRAFT_590179 [Radiomyces spectabilis]